MATRPNAKTETGTNAKSLEELLGACRDEYRRTLLAALDQLWLDGRSRKYLTTEELNAVNSAKHELRVEWGLQGWHEPSRLVP